MHFSILYYYNKWLYQMGLTLFSIVLIFVVSFKDIKIIVKKYIYHYYAY